MRSLEVKELLLEELSNRHIRIHSEKYRMREWYVSKSVNSKYSLTQNSWVANILEYSKENCHSCFNKSQLQNLDGQTKLRNTNCLCQPFMFFIAMLSRLFDNFIDLYLVISWYRSSSDWLVIWYFLYCLNFSRLDISRLVVVYHTLDYRNLYFAQNRHTFCKLKTNYRTDDWPINFINGVCLVHETVRNP